MFLSKLHLNQIILVAINKQQKKPSDEELKHKTHHMVSKITWFKQNYDSLVQVGQHIAVNNRPLREMLKAPGLLQQ